MIRRRDPLADPHELIRRVYSYAAYVLGDGPEAEDVTSEAVERAVRYRDSYDPSKSSPETWLVGIARRCIAGRKLQPRLAPEEALEDVATLEDVEADAVTRVTMRAAVARLPERDREIVALRYGSDLTAREIGEVLEMSTNAVEVALNRLHTKLRVDLDTAAAHKAEISRKVPRKDLGSAAGI
jgi:RNA polymerase sigma factor (sigma-70 family)